MKTLAIWCSISFIWLPIFTLLFATLKEFFKRDEVDYIKVEFDAFKLYNTLLPYTTLLGLILFFI